MQPTISIITPSFNQARFLPRTIESVLTQDYPNMEYILMDGGSTDGSLEIIRNYADRLSYWESKPDRGQTDAINKGFARATGKYLAWLNSDDVYKPGAISEAVDFLENHPEAAMVYGDCTFIDAQDRKSGAFRQHRRMFTAYDGDMYTFPSRHRFLGLTCGARSDRWTSVFILPWIMTCGYAWLKKLR